jgi:hypothetical protein
VLLASVLLAALVAVRAPGTIRRGTTSARYVLAALGFLSLALLSFVPSVVSALAAATTVTHLNQPLGRSFVVLALLTGQTALQIAIDPTSCDGLRRSARAALVTIGVMGVAFAITPDNGAAEYATRPDLEPSTAALIVAFLAYITYAVSTILVGALRQSVTAPASTRLSLRFIAAGCVCCLAYSAAKVVEIGAIVRGHPLPPSLEQLATHGVVAVGALLVGIGVSVVSLSQRLGGLGLEVREYVACRRLRRVWSELTAFASVAVQERDVGAWRDALHGRRLHERLYRRLVELRDAWLELRPYFDADVVADWPMPSAEATGDLSPAMWARLLSNAATAAERGSEPRRVWVAEAPAHSTMDDELNWWLAVAREWTGPARDTKSGPVAREALAS